MSDQILRKLRTQVQDTQREIRTIKARLPPEARDLSIEAVTARLDALERRLDAIDRGNK